jgi:hypothetical protein
MKNFRKNNQGIFICEECEKNFIKLDGLSKHINLNHISTKNYYDKWIKEKEEGLCKICKNPTQWQGRISIGYNNCCCKKCSIKYTDTKVKKSFIEKYGVNTPLKIKEIREKIKNTNKNKYGVEFPLQNISIVNKGRKTKNEKYINGNYDPENFKKTCQQRYGCNYPAQNKEIQEKNKKTCKEKYDVEYTFQSKEIKQKGEETKKEKRYSDINYLININKKIKQTKKEKYGDENYNNRKKSKETCREKYKVENPAQNKKTFDKTQKSALRVKKFRDTNIWYQGSYELDFLEKYYILFMDLQRGPTIKYIFEGKNKVYYPDFYIPSLNLIIECKNSYLMKRDLNMINSKREECIKKKYDYILIENKNYFEFENKFINENS